MNAHRLAESPETLDRGSWQLVGAHRVWVADQSPEEIKPLLKVVDFATDLITEYDRQEAWKRDLAREARKQAKKRRLAELGVEPCHVRFWARRNGIPVADSGVLSTRIIDRFEAAALGGDR